MEYIQTVLGKITPDEMGFTLPHEHIFWDLEFYLPKDLDICDMSDVRNQPLRMDMLGDLHYHLSEYRDNIVQYDVEPAVRELKWFYEAGGRTICDCTVPGMGRSPEKVREVSRLSGVNIICGTGAYCSYTLPKDLDCKTMEEMAEIFISEIRDGIGDTGIKCGFIGEIGINEGFPEGDRRTLAAAAIAQKETGAAILIHQPGLEKIADEMFDIIVSNGGRLDRTVMCHCDPLIPDNKYIDYMAKSGAYISFDFFGLEIVLTLKHYKNLWLPTDRDRINAIKEQIELGNLNKIVMSHDTVYKSMWRQYGGFGYAHIKKDILPLMLSEGYNEQWLKTITIENPKKVFTLNS